MAENNFPFSVSRNNFQIVEQHVDVDQFQAHWTIWHTGAVFGLICGFFSAVMGLILCAATYFAAASISEVNIITNVNLIGTCLTIATIPLLMLGAHCLDKIDDSVKMRESAFKEKKRARLMNAV